LIDERVVHDHIGLLQAGKRIEREQPGIARSRTGKPDVARFQHRNAGALSG
jgi:hypothetical protein